MQYIKDHVVNKQGIRIDYIMGISNSSTITQHWWAGTKQAQISDLKPHEFSDIAREHIIAVWHIKERH